MARNLSISNSQLLLKQVNEEPLMPDAVILKERLSQIPFYAQKAGNGNGYWNNLASSMVNL